jgi:hypothetical protein
MPSRHARSGVVLVMISAVLAILAAGFVGFVLWPRWPDAGTAEAAPSLPISIGGRVFNIPPAAIRVPVQRRAGPQERIDLAFLWPDLMPPDAAAKPLLRERSSDFDRLFITLAVPSGALPVPERFREIYPRYFADAQFQGPDGLVVKRFRDGTPYQGDDLFYDPTAPDRFIARCSRPGAGDTPGICLVERRLGGSTDVTVRFPRDWLSEWRTLSADISRLIDTLQAPRG